MQDNLYISYQCYQESTAESASNAYAASPDITHIPPNISVPVPPSAVMPVILNDDSSTGNVGRVAQPPFHPTSTPPVPLTSCYPSNTSIDAHLRPWISEAERYAPQSGWNASNVADTRFSRSQVPSDSTDLDLFERGKAWMHRGNDHQAVGAPAQPAQTDYPSYQVPTWLHMPTRTHSEVGVSCRPASQVQTTGYDGVSNWMAQSVLSQVTSLSGYRRRARRAHAHPERVICDTCQKQMRRQSLKRHVREVHNRIKRHAKPIFDSGYQRDKLQRD